MAFGQAGPATDAGIMPRWGPKGGEADSHIRHIGGLPGGPARTSTLREESLVYKAALVLLAFAVGFVAAFVTFKVIVCLSRMFTASLCAPPFASMICAVPGSRSRTLLVPLWALPHTRLTVPLLLALPLPPPGPARPLRGQARLPKHVVCPPRPHPRHLHSPRCLRGRRAQPGPPPPPRRPARARPAAAGPFRDGRRREHRPLRRPSRPAPARALIRLLGRCASPRRLCPRTVPPAGAREGAL